MALPVVSVPNYTIVLPSDNKKISFRPFLVKEEKLLLMAKEGRSSKEIKDVILQLLTDCTVGEKVDMSKRPTYDIEYFFLNLRAKSISEIAEISIKSPHKNKDGEECLTEVHDIKINLNDVKVEFPKDFNRLIEINDKIKVQMKHINMDNVSEFEDLDESGEVTDKNIDRIMEMIASSIEIIMEGEKVYDTKDYKLEEVISFLSGFKLDQLNKIQSFLQNYPQLSHEHKFKCNTCGSELSIKIKGLTNFF